MVLPINTPINPTTLPTLNDPNIAVDGQKNLKRAKELYRQLYAAAKKEFGDALNEAELRTRVNQLMHLINAQDEDIFLFTKKDYCRARRVIRSLATKAYVSPNPGRNRDSATAANRIKDAVSSYGGRTHLGQPPLQEPEFTFKPASFSNIARAFYAKAVDTIENTELELRVNYRTRLQELNAISLTQPTGQK